MCVQFSFSTIIINYRYFVTKYHRLKMEIDLQSLFGLHVTWCAQLYSLVETPQLPTPPAFGLVIRGGYIGQQRSTTSLCNPLLTIFPFQTRLREWSCEWVAAWSRGGGRASPSQGRRDWRGRWSVRCGAASLSQPSSGPSATSPWRLPVWVAIPQVRYELLTSYFGSDLVPWDRKR